MKLTIYRKLMIGFGLVIFLMAIATAYVVLQLHRVTGTSRTALTVDVQAIDLEKEMRNILYEEERYADRFFLAGDTSYRNIFMDYNRQFVRDVDSLYGILIDPHERQALDLAGQVHDWHFTSVVGADPSISALNQRADAMDRIRKSLDQLVVSRQRAVDASVQSIDRATERSLRVALLIAIGTLIAAIGTALVITGTITRPIGTLVAGTKVIAGGAFTHIRIPSHDELADLARAFNAMSRSLDELNKFRAEMMQHISHELRMPLQSILSAHYLLTRKGDSPLTENQNKLLNGIRDNVQKIANFSNQFLDLSKVEAGMMQYHVTPVDLAAVVKPVVDDAALVAQGKEIAMTFVAQDVPPVCIDPDRSREIFGNLVSNALKYTGNGGTISVSVGPCQFGVQVAVRDSGPGIPKDDLPRIFRKFYRTNSAVSGGSRGTGIGLAFVKAMVEGQGGRVYVNSTVGVGSTFVVEFPAHTLQMTGS
ncbi:MAG TPA: ATP-binding protein [Bacteroidota bacterium]|nr:ATP-binding protein [Bacteroidota bacterium]